MNSRAIFILIVGAVLSYWAESQLVSGKGNIPYQVTYSKLESLLVSPEKLALPLPKNEALSTKFTRLERKMGFSGAVIVAENQEIIHASSHGFLKGNQGDSLNLHTPMQLASVSKVITATSVLQLYDAGKIRDLNDSVRQYLPDFPYPGVTIRHLLIHRSGIPRYMPIAEKRWNADSMLSNQDMLQLMLTDSQQPYFSAGNGFNYLNTNYAMLALLVEKVAGIPFADYVDQYIFQVAGMDDSFVLKDGLTQGEKVAFGHRRRRRGYRPIQLEFLDGVVGDKGIYCSAIDLFKFDKALQSGQLLSPESQEESYCPGSPNRRYTNYGLGWRMRKSVDQVVYHFGWWRGFRTAFIKDVTHNRTIIVLSNREDMRRYFSPWELMCDFYEAK